MNNVGVFTQKKTRRDVTDYHHQIDVIFQPYGKSEPEHRRFQSLYLIDLMSIPACGHREVADR